MPSKRTSVALLILIFVAAIFLLHATAAETPHSTLLALSKGDHTLSIIDPATLKILATVPSGPDPHEVIASTDGKFAYISNYGSGTFNTITPVDLQTQKTLPAIDLGALRGPHGLTFVAGKLWFTVEGSKAIGSYDPATQKIDFVLGTGQDRTHMLYVFPDANPIITTNVNSATVSIIEKSSATTRSSDGKPLPGPPPGGPGGLPLARYDQAVIPVGHGSEGFDVSPGGKEIWVANAEDGTISIINLADKKVVQTLDANARSANRLKFTPEGKLAFVSMLASPDAVVFDTATRKEVKRIPIGHGAAGILMHPNGQQAYIACTPDNYVAVIDIKSLEVTAKIPNIKNPDGLAWAERK
jgi:YVTN family beta-propeller protein